jgi:hypothetical protein
MGNTLSSNLFEDDPKEDSYNNRSDNKQPRNEKRKRRARTIRRKQVEHYNPPQDYYDDDVDMNDEGSNKKDEVEYDQELENITPVHKKRRKPVTYKSRNNTNN